MISENLAIVKENIKRALEKTKRTTEDIKIVCVIKGRSLEEVKKAISCGIIDIGENKVQEAKEKYNRFHLRGGIGIRWHLVGHLQTNKVKEAVKIFDLIHSVDSVKLASEIDKQAARINKIQDILIEVNASGEETKFGVKPEELPDLVKATVNLKNIRLLGLMTIAPLVKDKEEVRPYFRRLCQLQRELNNFLLKAYNLQLMTLSMGMSQDYEVAVEEGATTVRIGTAIFEK